MNTVSSGVRTNIGSIQLMRSLVSGVTDDEGGGVGVRTNDGSVWVTNSTVSGNGRGVAVGTYGWMAVDASTVTANTVMGVDGPPGAIHLRNSIIADNCQDCGVAADSAIFSMDSDGSCGVAGGGNLSNVNPLLGPLADNGGPP